MKIKKWIRYLTMMKISTFFVLLLFLAIANFTTAQPKDISSELVMSMSQRSLVMPGYLTELKALIARQAYNFWKTENVEPYVSHLQVYSSLHQANKFLNYDSTRQLYYNQVGFHDRKVTSIEFGQEPNRYYSASSDGTVYKWNLENPNAIPETVFQSEKIIRSIDISADGKFLLVVFYQTGVALVSLESTSNGDIEAFEDPEPVKTAIFYPAEKQYLTVTEDGALKIKGFNTTTKQIGKTALNVKTVEVDENDGTIYAGSIQGVLEAWSKPYSEDADIKLNSWDQQSYFGYQLGSFAINCMDISPDGKLMAIGRERGDVIIWNLAEKQLERIISSHQSAITDIEFSPNNKQLLTTSRDKTARIWDLMDSRKLPIILDDHDNWVLSGCFDPSGNKVITGSSDRYLRTWPVDSKFLAERVCELVSRNMTPEEWKEFVGPDVPYQKTCAGK